MLLDETHVGILVPASPLSEGGRPRPPTAKRPHLDWTPKRNLTKDYPTSDERAAICDGETVSGKGLTATQPDSAVSGALCATDLAGKGRSGDLAVELCAPQLGTCLQGAVRWQWGSVRHG